MSISILIYDFRGNYYNNRKYISAFFLNNYISAFEILIIIVVYRKVSIKLMQHRKQRDFNILLSFISFLLKW